MDSTDKVNDADSTELAEGYVHKIAKFANDSSKELNGAAIAEPKTTSTSYKYHSFAKDPLFGTNGPSIDDIAQGQTGDCYFLSTMGSIAKIDPTKIEQSITPLGDGTFAVEFFKGTTPVFERVDANLPTYSWSTTTPAYENVGQDNSIWAPLVEKAFAYFRKGQNSYASIGSGIMSEVYADFGVGSATITPGSAADANTYAQQIEALLDAGDSVTAAVYNVPAGANLIGSHAYAVISVTNNNDGTYSVTVRNPWGVDGNTSTDGNNDGYVTLTAAQAFAGLAVVQSATV
jgi:hypothetical protein